MSRRNQKKARQPIDLTQEALRLVRSGRTAGLEIRMLGSTAVAAKCLASRDLLHRHNAIPKDIDLAGLAHQRRRIRDFLYGQGLTTPGGGLITPYMDRDVFGAHRGNQILLVEVFFDELRFIHRIPFRSDFARTFPTLPLDTLIMSKLQMRQKSFTDWLHLAALLVQCNADKDDKRSFDPSRITRQAETDYRCWRDFKDSLEELLSPERVDSFGLTTDEAASLAAGAECVKGAIAATRHGPRWVLGLVKASLKIEPREPEVGEYWDAG
jgi:hypothetical protein